MHKNNLVFLTSSIFEYLALSFSAIAGEGRLVTYPASVGESVCIGIPDASGAPIRKVYAPWLGEFATAEKKTLAANWYRVFVNGRELDVYRASSPLFEGEEYYYVYFDFKGKVDVRIDSGTTLEKAELFPDKFGGLKKSGDRRAEFSVDKPFKTVFIRNERKMPLIIFGNKIESSVPDKNDPNVKWFGADVHLLDKPIELGDGQTLYVADGAVLKASIHAKGKNIKICGRGIISGERFPKFSRPFTYFKDCENLEIEGVIFTESNSWTVVLQDCKNVKIDDVKICCSRILNDDAFDICNSSDVKISDVFARAQDDIIAVKGTIAKVCERIDIEDCIFWTDRANIYRVGYECDAVAMRDIHSKNICVPFFSKDSRPVTHYWANGIIFLQPSNEMEISRMSFENFKVRTVGGEDSVMILMSPRIINLRNYKKAGFIRDCSVKNFSVVGRKFGLKGTAFKGIIRIDGMDEAGTNFGTKNIELENIRYFGERLTAESPDVEIDTKHTENIVLR